MLKQLACIKVYNYFSADFLEEHRRVLESRLSPVVREITDSRARNRDELEGYFTCFGCRINFCCSRLPTAIMQCYVVFIRF